MKKANKNFSFSTLQNVLSNEQTLNDVSSKRKKKNSLLTKNLKRFNVI